MNAKNFGHFNELRRETERRLADDANRADAIVGSVCLVLCFGYAVARYLGVVA